MKTMRNFNYSVIITTEDNRFTYETNDVRDAIQTVFECDFEDANICICNGCTGEVLYHNGDEPWCTDEMSLMMLGFVTEQANAEEDEDEDYEEEVSGSLIDFLDEMVAQGKAVKLGGLPS